MLTKTRLLCAFALFLGTASSAQAVVVSWTNWQGREGSSYAFGQIKHGDSTVGVSVQGPLPPVSTPARRARLSPAPSDDTTAPSFSPSAIKADRRPFSSASKSRIPPPFFRTHRSGRSRGRPESTPHLPSAS